MCREQKRNSFTRFEIDRKKNKKSIKKILEQTLMLEPKLKCFGIACRWLTVLVILLKQWQEVKKVHLLHLLVHLYVQYLCLTISIFFVLPILF